MLEALIALSILSIALVGLFQAHSTGLRTAAAAGTYAEARILAHSLLAGALSGPGEPPKPSSGRSGAMEWAITVTEARKGLAGPSTKWRLYHVQVVVAAPDKRRLELDGLKLARLAERGDQ